MFPRRKPSRKRYFQNYYKRIRESKILMTPEERKQKRLDRKREKLAELERQQAQAIKMHSEQLEVLNISNVNASGKTVLNDEKLLELIQMYPFLYNPDVEPFQDPDYSEWAWIRIASALNKTYTNHIHEEAFSVHVLINRWNLLKPIILSLSKSYDINAIPSLLRQHVINLSQHLEKERPEIKPTPFSSAQNIILENIEMVERLPLSFRKKLETEMVSLILKTELETKGTGTVDTLETELECQIFLQEIGVNYQCKYLNGNKLDTHNNSLPMMVSLPRSDETEMIIPDTHDTNAAFTLYEKMDQLLVPLDRPRWIPINHAPLYIQNCVVRVKRLKFLPDDDIPLSQIKKENSW